MPVKNYCLTIFMLVFCSITGVIAQKTIVKGKVIDSSTGEVLPFVNIAYLHSTIGTISDNDGHFYLETLHPTDSIVASSLGYELERKHVVKGISQEFVFNLKPISLNIEEVVVKPGENPAFRILRQIYDHKKFNNPEKYTSYQYRSYNKLRLDVNNIDNNFKKQPLFKNFQFAFNYMDTSQVFGKNYLPILISESSTHFYYQKSPRIQKEVINAFKMSGVDNKTVSQFSGKMYQQFNIYDNFMTLFEPGFVSPIADFGKLYYKYYLEDSASIDGNWCYKISFKPKRKMERTFYGYFWVADTSWAIKKIQLRVSPDVNINLLNDMIVVDEYSRINDSVWFLTKEDLLMDFYLTDKTFGFFGRKSSVYDSILVDQPIPDRIKNLNTDTYVNDQHLDRNESYWDKERKEELTPEDAKTYQMVDSIQKVPFYKTIYGLANMLVDYYYVVGPVELGPYYTLYSHNPIEGNRFRIGGRTSNNFSTKVLLGGHVAYGLGDQRFKYGLEGQYMFNVNPRRDADITYYHDIRQLGKSNNAFLDDNIMTTLLRRRQNYKLTMVDQFNAYYEHEWFQGFSNTISVQHQTIYPTEYIPFTVTDVLGDSVPKESVTSSEITLSTHFSWHEKFLLGKFERVSLGSYYPAVDFDLTYGPKGVLGSNYEYLKLKLNISDKVEVNPFGYFKYRVTAGKILGTLPYPLLELHPGNETYAYDPYAFNMMNYYEFVSDEYLVLSAEQHFDGFFLDHIPLLRRLGFREVVSGKVLFGSLRPENRTVMQFPVGLGTLTNKPYMEGGIGVENILKILRIDATWRFTYRDNPGIQNFGLRATLQFNF